MNRGVMRMGGILAVGAFVLAGLPVAASAQGNAVEVPLSFTNGRLMVPVVSADGAELNFILSTGNVTTILSESAAATIEAAGGATMAGIAVPFESAVRLPDAQLNVGGQQIAGMIAADVLGQYDILIDVPNGQLSLKSPGPRVQWPGATLSRPTRMRVYHGVVLSIDVRIGDQEMGAMIDLGAAPALIASPSAGARLGVTDTATRDLVLGERTFAGLALSVQDIDVFSRFDPNGAGFAMVGAGFAENCAIAISWIHQEIRTCVQ